MPSYASTDRQQGICATQLWTHNTARLVPQPDDVTPPACVRKPRWPPDERSRLAPSEAALSKKQCFSSRPQLRKTYGKQPCSGEGPWYLQNLSSLPDSSSTRDVEGRLLRGGQRDNKTLERVRAREEHAGFDLQREVHNAEDGGQFVTYFVVASRLVASPLPQRSACSQHAKAFESLVISEYGDPLDCRSSVARSVASTSTRRRWRIWHSFKASWPKFSSSGRRLGWAWAREFDCGVRKRAVCVTLCLSVGKGA